MVLLWCIVCEPLTSPGSDPCSHTWDGTLGDNRLRPYQSWHSQPSLHHHLWWLRPSHRGTVTWHPEGPRKSNCSRPQFHLSQTPHPVWRERCELFLPESAIYPGCWGVISMCGMEPVLISGQQQSWAPLDLPGLPVGISLLNSQDMLVCVGRAHGLWAVLEVDQ